jgi:hypothetical protein
MTVLKTIAGLSAVAAASIALVAPSASFASQQGRNTLTGGLLGAGAGAVLSHGSVGGTLAGAAGGALIGNALSNHHKHYRRGYYGHSAYRRY